MVTKWALNRVAQIQYFNECSSKSKVYFGTQEDPQTHMHPVDAQT